MDILDKFSAVKEHADLLAIPFLSIAYCDYFPASLREGSDIAWLYSVSPSLGVAANLIVAAAVAIVSYALLFAGASYFSAYHSVPMFPILGFIALAMAFAPQFGLQDFTWIKPSLSFALGAVGLSMLSLGFIAERST